MPHIGLKEGVIRRVSGTERQDFRDHLLRLSPKSRRSRFTGSVSDLFIEQHVDRLFSSEAIVYGWVVDGVIRAGAELHPVGGPLRATAEAAFSVEEGWQDTGVGTALLGRVLRAARNRGLSRLIMTCLPENARMQRVARKHGARLQWQEGDVHGLINPPVPTPISLWREAMEEGEGFMNALFRPPKVAAE
ncbi:GNAT family N-acetyltransferase [Microbaculum marinisediminis]|uniref:GNAT family N-acetyltransferase n=1 Tax=Microbaculum marinisediminis TaxID=2931392 RepID=A0AAW5R3X5_9HYPH|nr:GNAT family N-acetyltransferase [Microbaculum sp. A6E488]MCT8973568.1 GNAT family N-acetyltransferase [Microbaculum sp. A6E488]